MRRTQALCIWLKASTHIWHPGWARALPILPSKNVVSIAKGPTVRLIHWRMGKAGVATPSKPYYSPTTGTHMCAAFRTKWLWPLDD